MEGFECHLPHDLEPNQSRLELQRQLDAMFAEHDRQVILILAKYLRQDDGTTSE